MPDGRWRRRLWLLGTGVTLLVLVWRAYRSVREAELAQIEAVRAASLTRIAALTARADSLEAVSESLRTAYRADTVRLTYWKTRWDTVRVPDSTATAAVPWDTAQIREHLRRDSTVVAVADTTIRACTTALGTCVLRVTAESTQASLWHHAYDSLAHLPAKPPPPWWKRWGKRTAEWLAFWRLGRAMR